MLLRFPTAAEDTASLLRKGRVLVKAEISLMYGGYEIVPEGYTCRDGLGRPLWTRDPPTWHVQAWPLRHPWSADPAETRPYFRKLAELARQHNLPKLSMGMSHDFEIAIEEGATLVRVGTAIFGARHV